MIKSPVYEQILKEGRQEGREEGREEAFKSSVIAVLEARFEVVPQDIVGEIESIERLNQLETLHKKAVGVKDLEEFHDFLGKIKAS